MTTVCLPASFWEHIMRTRSAFVKKVYMVSDFVWPFLTPNMSVIPNPKMVFIFPISCILVLIFPFFMKYFPKCAGNGSFPKSQIKSLMVVFH